MSHRDPPQLSRLVSRVLDGDRTVALVHHDPRGVPAGLTASDRVLLVDDPGPCDWGRMNQARTMLKCFSEAQRQVPDLDWLLLVSGQDYPAMHMRAVERTLAESDTDGFLRHFPVPIHPQPDEHTWVTRCRGRYLRRHRVPGSRRSVPFPRRHPFGDATQLYIGDTWMNLRSTAVQHVVDQARRRPDLDRYFEWCGSPDEAYVPTLLLNDAADLRLLPDRKRYIEWEPGSKHPRTLDATSFDAIVSSGDFFARKVDTVKSGELLDRLDLDLLDADTEPSSRST